MSTQPPSIQLPRLNSSNQTNLWLDPSLHPHLPQHKCLVKLSRVILRRELISAFATTTTAALSASCGAASSGGGAGWRKDRAEDDVWAVQDRSGYADEEVGGVGCCCGVLFCGISISKGDGVE